MPPMEIKEASRLECYWNSLDVCDWCGEEQASELRLLCLEQIWMRATSPSLIFQWCDCSENFLNGAAISKIFSRVWLHLASPEVASPQGYRFTCACFPMVQLHLAPLEEMVLLLLKGATAFSCLEKIILSHHFLIYFLWCSWCSPQWCASHLKTNAVVFPPMVRLSPQDSCGCSPKKKSFQGCVSHPQVHAVVLLKNIISRVRLSPPGSCGCFPQKNPFKSASLTPRLMRLFS